MPTRRICAGSYTPTSSGSLGVDWTPFVVKNSVELILRLVSLLTTWGTIHGTDGVVRLALAREIPLVAGSSKVVVKLPIVIVVTTWETTALLLLFVCPVLHHVA